MAHDLEVSRRDFLKIGGGSVTLSLFASAGISGFVPTVAEAATAELKTLNKQEARMLVAVARTLFPHDFLADSYYQGAVAAVDAKASADQTVAAAVKEGLAGLGADFILLAEAKREEKLKGMEKTPFFSLIYGATVNALYTNQDVWNLLGFEGSSVEKGGYINRGFDDIDWLPNS